ncbi:hypothetical protein [Paenarthrobacter sp. PH39-S1]|uniref:FitA-like ribbon-helix-helix domain-containing protein n=1 Tax=Paenarthrobacter sp. PH39-S1 TaxID=3046204 RepID=UPI0024B97314|nr:hypothetical protein [Paenarthrobacter sp. PH39-S1]MDJ0356543.1 hypothetical protein [Paenarthrobacter sp. PH39-S1]
MSSVTVRYLDPEVVAQLRVLAAQNGRSMQVELKVMILRHLDSPTAQGPDPSSIPIALLKVPQWYEELFESQAMAFALGGAHLPPRISTMHMVAATHDPGD